MEIEGYDAIQELSRVGPYALYRGVRKGDQLGVLLKTLMRVGLRPAEDESLAREYEFMRILAGADGKLQYVAIPSGQPEAAFPVKEIAENAVTFENPQHDFPQRILYRLVDKDTLVARIEGSVGGQARAADFPYKRCPNGM